MHSKITLKLDIIFRDIAGQCFDKGIGLGTGLRQGEICLEQNALPGQNRNQHAISMQVGY